MKFIIYLVYFLLILSFCFSNTNKVYLKLPGVSDKFDTEDTIQKLMAVKKLPITKKELSIKDIEIENSIIKDFSSYLRNLDAKSKSLYDYQSPFREMKGNSENEKYVRVSVNRKAQKNNYKIKVVQTAKPDSFKTDSIPGDRNLPPTEFEIIVNNEKVKIKFPGGTIFKLADTIQKSASNLINVKTVNDSFNTSVLVINGNNTGSKNKIIFSGDINFLESIGLLTRNAVSGKYYDIDFSFLNNLNTNIIKSDKRNIFLDTDNYVEINLSSMSLFVSNNTYLVFNVRIIDKDLSIKKKDDFSNFEINLMEPIIITSNLSVNGGSFLTIYEEEEPIREILTNFNNILKIVFNDNTEKIISVVDSGVITNSFEGYYGKKIEKIIFYNPNVDKIYHFSDFLIYYQSEDRELAPKNPISLASDAIIYLDGVEIRRDKNIINDIIDGATLQLYNETSDDLVINIDFDYDKIKRSIMDWVHSYNQVMEYLYILTFPNKDRTPLHERDQENLKNGVFQTESSFLNLRNKLRDVIMRAYPTSSGNELSLLEQIGIYTKKAGAFSTDSDEWKTTKMGLLNIDEEKLDNALRVNLQGVESLFAFDTDGDLAKDTGVAVEINKSLRGAIGVGSFIERKITFNDKKIKDLNKEVEDMYKDFADYEISLRNKFGKMNQVINSTEARKKWLDAQMKRGE